MCSARRNTAENKVRGSVDTVESGVVLYPLHLSSVHTGVISAAAGLVVVGAMWLAATAESPVGMLAVLVLGAWCGACTGMTLAARRDLGKALAVIAEEGRAFAYDSVTGLLNRRPMMVDLDRRLRDNGNSLIVVLVCRLGRLKTLNEAFGYEAGDRVLAAVAKRLLEFTESADLLARHDGDKFVLVTDRLLSDRDAVRLADRIASLIDDLVIEEKGSTLGLTANIGIALCAPSDVDSRAISAAMLLRNAEVALNNAADDPWSHYAIYETEMSDSAFGKISLEQELRKGIRSGQIFPHYQPVVDTTTGSVDRFEALVRWNHPTRGMIHPLEFLPLASESGLILEVGQIMLEMACRQCVDWSDQCGQPLVVAVNIGERELVDERLIGSVSRALAASGLAPTQLELEISEDLVVSQPDKALAVLNRLELMGVRLAVDNFGASQASLRLLRDLPMVSTLKLDRGIVENIANYDFDEWMTSMVVELAHRLGKTVVAEGVETAEQAAKLKAAGIDLLQGFFYGRPGPAGEMILGEPLTLVDSSLPEPL